MKMILKRLSSIMFLMISFWVVVIISSWLLANFYMPWIKNVTFGLIPGGIADTLLWVSVVIIFIMILILFRKLFHELFRMRAKNKIS